MDILTTLKILIIGESGVGKSRWEIRRILSVTQKLLFFWGSSSYYLFFFVFSAMYVVSSRWFRWEWHILRFILGVKRWFTMKSKVPRWLTHTLIVCLSLFCVSLSPLFMYSCFLLLFFYRFYIYVKLRGKELT